MTNQSRTEPKTQNGGNDSDALILIDEQRHIVWMNATAEQLTGQSASNLSGTRYCHELFHCCDETGRRLFGPDCPGQQGFAQRSQATTKEYTITRGDGEPVRVVSQYHFVHRPANGHSLGMIRMKRLAPATKAPPGLSRGLIAVAALIGAVLMMAVVVAGSSLNSRASEWTEVGSLAKVKADPTAMSFTYANPTAAEGATLGVIYAAVERGKPAWAVSAECPWDGSVVNWNPKKDVFICPTDWSIWDREGTFYKGRAGISLPKLSAELDGTTVRVRLPRWRSTPMKDQPQNYEPDFWGP